MITDGNRGVFVPPLDQVTDDGFDMQWGTNVVGAFVQLV